MIEIPPLLILAVGVLTVIGMIVVLRINAFVALITAALVVSLMAPGAVADKVGRVAAAFGSTAEGIGIVIALAAIIGKAMMDSGAADRIVRTFLAMLGERRSGTALLGSGFVLAVPVFFDTVFYLLVPLARSMYRQTNRHYLKYLTAIAAGGAITHTLVPPTPGPLIIASNLHVELGWMIMVGAIVAIPAAVVGLAYGSWIDRRMSVPMRSYGEGMEEAEPLGERELPRLGWAVLPIVLPVALISANTVVQTLSDRAAEGAAITEVARWTALVGNANLALLLSAAVAVTMLYFQRRPTRDQMSGTIESALMSGGLIILITAAGGAFGEMLKVAQIGPAIEGMFRGQDGAQLTGMVMLGFAFMIAALIKFAQGSSTVAMITASAMMAAMLIPATIEGMPADEAGPGVINALLSEKLGFAPVYLATAVGSGSLVGSWMNDSGFWIFTKMGGLTEIESLKSWTPLLAILGVVGFLTTAVLAMLVPMA